MEHESEYRSFLLRLWRTTSAGRIVWHALLRDIATGERRNFADLQSLFAYLEAQARNAGGGEPDER